MLTREQITSAEKFIVIGWPEIQDYFDFDDFDENAYLLEGESSEYAVSVDWLNENTRE